jgi:hypothetical protein
MAGEILLGLYGIFAFESYFFPCRSFGRDLCAELGFSIALA